jgi:SAM-dependent methyltransferase
LLEKSKTMDILDYHLQKDKGYLHFWYQARNGFISSWLGRLYPGAKGDLAIMDLGCGCACELESLKKFGSVKGLEVNRESAEIARSKGVEVVVSDIAEADIGGDVYDLVAALDFLEHVKDDRAVLAKIHASLKPGGRALIMVPAHAFLFGPHDRAMGHWRRYSLKELKEKLAAAGFRDVKIGYWNVLLFPFIFIWRLVKRMVVPKAAATQDFSIPSRAANLFFLNIILLENIFYPLTRFLPGLSLTVSAKK